MTRRLIIFLKKNLLRHF